MGFRRLFEEDLTYTDEAQKIAFDFDKKVKEVFDKLKVRPIASDKRFSFT